MKKLNILAIGIILVVGLNLVSAGNLFGGNRDNRILNDGTGNGGFLSNIFGGNNNNDNENNSSNAPTFEEYDFEASGIDLDSLEWDVDPPVWHSADEIKIRANDGNYYSLQEALDHGLIKLPTGKIPQGILIDFSLPKGSPEWYDKVCPVVYGRNKKEQYADYSGEFVITNPFIYKEGVYDFSCTIGNKSGTVTSRVQLSENYTVLFTTKEPRIEKIVAVFGDEKIENGVDKYSYLVALEGNKLKFRITRPSSCRNNLISSINIPLCSSSQLGQDESIISPSLLPNNPIFGIKSDSSGEDLAFEKLSNNVCDSTDPSCWGSPQRGGCTGPVCSCKIGVTPGCHEQEIELPENDASTLERYWLDCSNQIPINLPEQSCSNDQCPIYTVKSGIFGGFKEKEVYNWQELKCNVRAAY